MPPTLRLAPLLAAVLLLIAPITPTAAANDRRAESVPIPDGAVPAVTLVAFGGQTAKLKELKLYADGPAELYLPGRMAMTTNYDFHGPTNTWARQRPVVIRWRNWAVVGNELRLTDGTRDDRTFALYRDDATGYLITDPRPDQHLTLAPPLVLKPEAVGRVAGSYGTTSRDTLRPITEGGVRGGGSSTRTFHWDRGRYRIDTRSVGNVQGEGVGGAATRGDREAGRIEAGVGGSLRMVPDDGADPWVQRLCFRVGDDGQLRTYVSGTPVTATWSALTPDDLGRLSLPGVDVGSLPPRPAGATRPDVEEPAVAEPVYPVSLLVGSHEDGRAELVVQSHGKAVLVRRFPLETNAVGGAGGMRIESHQPAPERAVYDWTWDGQTLRLDGPEPVALTIGRDGEGLLLAGGGLELRRALLPKPQSVARLRGRFTKQAATVTDAITDGGATSRGRSTTTFTWDAGRYRIEEISRGSGVIGGDVGAAGVAAGGDVEAGAVTADGLTLVLTPDDGRPRRQYLTFGIQDGEPVTFVNFEYVDATWENLTPEDVTRSPMPPKR